MLFWLQEVFCSTQILDQNLPLDLRINKADISRASENKELCEHETLRQRSQESTKTEDEYMNDNQFNSNLSTDCTGKDLNRRNKNVDHDLFNFSSSTSATNNLVTPSFRRSTVIKYVSKKQYCTLKQSISDKTCLKTLNSSGNDTMEHSQINSPWNNNKNLLLHKNQNDLIQEQCVTSENNAFLQKNNSVLVLSKNQTYRVENNSVNEPSAVQTDASFNVGVSSTINNPESNFSFNNAYKNENNVKDKRKEFKTNKVSSIQIDGNEITLKSKRKRKTYKTILKNQFTASERELFKKYKKSEKNFKKFYKFDIKNQMLQFIKKLEISNLSNDLKQKSILALKNLLSFLDTINAIKINTNKKKNKKDFLNLLNLAYNQFSRYADVSQKLLIFKLTCKNLHKVNDSVFCKVSGCDFDEVNRLILFVERRFNSFYSRLKKLRVDFKKND